MSAAQARLSARSIIDRRRSWPARPSAPVLAASVVIAGLLLAAALVRAPALNAPALNAVLEMAMSCVALDAAWLMAAGVHDRRRVRDLLAMAAVASLGLVNLCDRVVPAVISPRTAAPFAGALLVGQLLPAGLLAATAFTSSTALLARPRLCLTCTAVGCVVAALAVSSPGLLLTASAIGRGPASSTALVHRPLALLICLAAIALCTVAALRLAAGDGGRAVPDRAVLALAGASGMLAVAGLPQLLDGLPGAGTVSAIQLPPAVAFGLVLLAATVDEASARGRMTRAAALVERRRVARDLHDRLAQDLAFIAAHGPALSERMGEDHPVVVAARRALVVSRSAITELSDPAQASTADTLEAIAQELRDQYDVAVAVNVALGDELDPAAREHISRISREAIANAARHGGARSVSVSLRRLELATVLRIVDDGCGPPDAGGAWGPEGFGLRSMRERAAALGGLLTVHRPRGGGAELEVVFR